MHNVRKINEDLFWVGSDENRLALFENIHPLPEGVSYNSYLLLDEKTALFDTVDWAVARQYFANIEHVLAGRKLDYLVINHMEPDHAACMEEVLLRYPEAKVICTNKAYLLMGQFGFNLEGVDLMEVKEGDTLETGKHKFLFIEAPMVHWPEAMVTLDLTNGYLFCADAFGSFGTLDGRLFDDELDFEGEYLDHARRYLTNIVGKYGPHVQHLLKKASGVELKMLLPLHGPVWRTNLGFIVDKYVKWSTYTPEEQGVLVLYGSMYGSTEAAARKLAVSLVEKGVTSIKLYDVSKTHESYLIAEAFKYSHMVLIAPTYNLNLYPPMENFLNHAKMLNLQNRTVGLVSNGSWAPVSGRIMREILDSMKNMTVLEEEVELMSAMSDRDLEAMEALADSIKKSLEAK